MAGTTAISEIVIRSRASLNASTLAIARIGAIWRVTACHNADIVIVLSRRAVEPTARALHLRPALPWAPNSPGARPRNGANLPQRADRQRGARLHLLRSTR